MSKRNTDITVYFGSRPSLKEKVERLARDERRSRNGLILLLLEEALESRGIQCPQPGRKQQGRKQ